MLDELTWCLDNIIQRAVMYEVIFARCDVWAIVIEMQIIFDSWMDGRNRWMNENDGWMDGRNRWMDEWIGGWMKNG